jgi:hypothetical protein
MELKVNSLLVITAGVDYCLLRETGQERGEAQISPCNLSTST